MTSSRNFGMTCQGPRGVERQPFAYLQKIWAWFWAHHRQVVDPLPEIM